MGIDGGMIVGSSLKGIPEEIVFILEQFQNKGLVVMHSYYDATDKFAVFYRIQCGQYKVDDIDQK